jgi:hypothetical protein
MSLMIALPCYGGQVSEKTTSGLFNLGKMLVRNDVPHGLLTLANSSLISQGRSKIANFFVNNTDYEYLFFLDSDIGFDPADVLKLMDYGRSITCAAYPMKTIPLRYNYTVSQPQVQQGSLIKINSMGMGFVMIHRQVFLDVQKKYGEELYYVPDNDSSNIAPTQEEKTNSFHYFLEMKRGPSYMAEDISFFTRAREVGHDAWLDTSVELCHIGNHVFRA